jgi:cold shock CspA family protein
MGQPVGTVKFFSDKFVAIGAVERAGMATLDERRRVSFDIVIDPKKTKQTRKT